MSRFSESCKLILSLPTGGIRWNELCSKERSDLAECHGMPYLAWYPLAFSRQTFCSPCSFDPSRVFNSRLDQKWLSGNENSQSAFLSRFSRFQTILCQRLSLLRSLMCTGPCTPNLCLESIRPWRQKPESSLSKPLPRVIMLTCQVRIADVIIGVLSDENRQLISFGRWVGLKMTKMFRFRG